MDRKYQGIHCIQPALGTPGHRDSDQGENEFQGVRACGFSLRRNRLNTTCITTEPHGGPDGTGDLRSPCLYYAAAEWFDPPMSMNQQFGNKNLE